MPVLLLILGGDTGEDAGDKAGEDVGDPAGDDGAVGAFAISSISDCDNVDGDSVEGDIIPPGNGADLVAMFLQFVVGLHLVQCNQDVNSKILKIKASSSHL